VRFGADGTYGAGWRGAAVPTCLQAATAVHSSPGNSAGMEFWVVVQPAGAPPLARAEFHMAGEFNATSASGSMCADCSGSGCNPMYSGCNPCIQTATARV
jgi:hypothetical protein